MQQEPGWPEKKPNDVHEAMRLEATACHKADEALQRHIEKLMPDHKKNCTS